MNCTHASGLTSRRGARYGWGAIISVSRVLDRLSFNPKRVIFNLCRNPKRCDSNCATSLMMSSNPVIFVAGRTHSCGQSRSTLDCMFLSICNRILLSVVGIASLGRLSNFSVRRWHTRLWVFKRFPTSDWVVISPSLYFSQGACARNSAIFAKPSTMYGPLGISGFRSSSFTSADVRGAWEAGSLFFLINAMGVWSPRKGWWRVVE